MKKLLLTLTLIISIIATAFTQAPQKFSYQAVVRDAGNNLVTNQPVGVRISILQGEVTGLAVFVETQVVSTNANGLMTLQIGGGAFVSGDMSGIDWADGPYFLKTETDPNGGTNYTIEGTQQLLSVPYALYAATSGNGVGPQGPQGEVGPAGPQGETGPAGPQGIQGPQGEMGPAGPQGVQGEVGPQGPAGQNGADGLNGQDGLSAYQIWLNAGHNGTEADFLASLVGATGAQGIQGEAGPQGVQGVQGPQGETGPAGPQGEQGLQGEVGPQGPQGIQGEVGPQGPAGQNGTDGLNGQDGLSAYQLWLNAGHNGTEAEFLASLVGATGAQGPQGERGLQGEQGVAGPQGERGPQGEVGPQGPQGIQGEVGPQGEQGPAGVGIPQTLSITGSQLTISDGNSIELPAGFDGDYNSLSNRPDLFSGDYNDLNNRPEIPTVPTNVSAFTNDAGYLTTATVQEAANIPTRVSAFNNDAGYITSADVPAQVNADWNATSGAAQIMNKPELFSGDYNDLTNQPTIPVVPTNVSAFTNDAHYITSASIPTNVSAFTNDRGYITSTDIPAYQVLSIRNDTIYLSNGGYAVLPAGFDGDYRSLSNRPDLFSGDYNDLSNRPTIPTVPTNVSAFANDAGYLTTATVQEAANIPTRVSAFTNDAGYITSSAVPTNVSQLNNDANYITSADVPAQVNADWNATEGAAQIVNKPDLFSGDYNDLANQPTIPTVPTNVSAFTNDANYITTANIPTQVSAFTNDAGYITSAAVPTDVSQLNNDANYITSADVPAQVNADWNATEGTAQIVNKPTLAPVATSGSYNDLTNQPVLFDGDYNSLTSRPDLFSGDYNDLSNQPAIPTTTNELTNNSGFITSADVPTNVSDLNNDAGYITNSAIPTQVSAFTNDAGYLTTYTEVQILSISNDTIYLTGGSYVKLPAGFSGSYNDLTDRPTIPSIPENVSTFSNDAGYLTRDSLESYSMAPSDIQNLLDRIAALEQTTNSPMVLTTELSFAFDGIRTGGNVFSSGSSAVTARGVCWSTHEMPTLSDNYTVDASGTGVFDSHIGGLAPSTTYYVRAYATNAAGTGYGVQYSITTDCPASLTDIDGNTYNTVWLGSQCWMKENLKTTKYADGTSISQGSSTSTATAYWYYPNNTSSNKDSYGLLYNWKAVMRNASSSSSNPSNVQGICPTGWHVPSDAEWTQLTDYVSSQSTYVCSSNSNYIAKALASTTGWSSSSETCAVGNSPSSNNATGFGAMPAGYYTGSYYSFGVSALYWSATENDNSDAFYRRLNDSHPGVHRYDENKCYGYSVRCLRD